MFSFLQLKSPTGSELWECEADEEPQDVTKESVPLPATIRQLIVVYTRMSHADVGVFVSLEDASPYTNHSHSVTRPLH